MTTTVSAPSSRGSRLLARASAEALGTLFLVVIGLGVFIFTTSQTNAVPAPLASGLAVTAAMLAFGYLSGGHFNPAVTVGHVIAGRTKPVDGAAYLGAQIVGGLLGALTVFAVVRTVPGVTDSRTYFDAAASGFDAHSSSQVPLSGVLLMEILGAALLVGIFLGATGRRNPLKAAAPFAVGLTFAVLLQLGQPIGNLAFNPARATASAVFGSGSGLGQLWLFWVAPVVGAAIAGLIFRGFGETAPAAVPEVEEPLPADGWDEKSDDDAEAAAPESAAEVSTPAAAPAATPVEAKPNGDPAREFFDGKRD
ncbi:MIP/aquaporin family protein [Arthrobacter sp. NPDC058127]|uniref:MIP/aquaporin family protein n=1 Tax=Arthrobacter sp. NPDC058127 TaxID=3346351 RepID=UPI0036F0F788